MASPHVDEKAGTPAVHSIQLSDTKPTVTTTLVPLTEKHPRVSEVSTPSSQNELNPFDTDVEAMVISTRTTNDDCGMKNIKVSHGPPECQVWPGQDHWKRKAKAAKINNRTCTRFAKLSKRNRILIKILIAVLVIGIAVAIGLGVSKSVGAPIWRSNDN